MKFEIKKKNWMQIHTYLSLFFLPVAVVYVLTGIGYIFDFDQDSGAEIHKIKLDSRPENGKESEEMIRILKENNLEIPHNTEVKMIKGNPSMGDVRYSASIVGEKNGDIVLKTNKRSMYGVLVMMHKSKGEKSDILWSKLSAFDIVAICFGLSLMLFYLSGLIVTSFCKKNRRTAFTWFICGFVIMFGALYLSV